MRNIETSTKTGPDDAGLNQMLTNARMEERRGRADVFAAHLEKTGGAHHLRQTQLHRSRRAAAKRS